MYFRLNEQQKPHSQHPSSTSSHSEDMSVLVIDWGAHRCYVAGLAYESHPRKQVHGDVESKKQSSTSNDESLTVLLLVYR